jgi:hypothetical protein
MIRKPKLNQLAHCGNNFFGHFGFFREAEIGILFVSRWRTINARVLNSNYLPPSFALEPRVRPHQAPALVLRVWQDRNAGF